MVKKMRTICMFCSLGCGINFRKSGENITAIDYDKENPVNKGSLCPRGYYNYELINHPQRLMEPHIGNKKVSWTDAITKVRENLKGYSAQEIAILVSSNASNEDAYLAAKMAQQLGTKNISGAGDPSDIEAYEGLSWQSSRTYMAEMNRFAECEYLLIIGDLLTRSPVLSKRVNEIKYGKRGNHIVVIDPNVTHTSWFATTHLKNRPGTEAVLLAAILKVISEENKRGKIDVDLIKASELTGIPEETIKRVAKSFDDSRAGCTIFVPSPNKERNDLIQYFMDIISGYSMGKKHITFYSYGNALGVNTIINSEVGEHASHKDIYKGLKDEKIKALFILGGGVSSPSPAPKMLVKTALFNEQDADKGTILLPLACHMERKGKVVFSGFRTESFSPIAHNIGNKSCWKIISSLMDLNIGYDEILQKTNDALIKDTGAKNIVLEDKIKEVLNIVPRQTATMDDVTHFGDNDLVKRFFWYRVNNKNG